MYDDNDGDEQNQLAQFTPAELRQLLTLGVAPEKQQMLQQQMMQAEALRQGSGQQHSSPLGALFGGVADAGGALLGGVRQHQLRDQMDQLMGGQVDARQMLLQKLLQGRQPPQAQPALPAGAGDLLPNDTYGMG
jgi:hypothetical protein